MLLTGHLNYKDRTNYQFIYATFFKGNYCIYAKLEVNSHDELESISLHLENYIGSMKLKPQGIITEFHQGVLRIGFEAIHIDPHELPNLPVKIDTRSLKINENNFKSIFVTRHRPHFSGLANHSRDNLINFTMELGHEANDSVRSAEQGSMNMVSALAVGRNCFTSYIKVNEI